MNRLGLVSMMWKCVLLCFIFISFSCFNESTNKQSDDDLAASVFDEKLYKSDIALNLSNNLSEEENKKLANSYIEHWVRKMILAHHAVKEIKQFDKIDRLVEDYKNSLIIEVFKNQYIIDNLDSTITKLEFEEYYEENKNNFILDESVVNLFYAKIHDEMHNLDKFYENWKKDKYKYISNYGVRNSDDYFLDKNKWYNLKEMKQKLPKFLLKNKDNYSIQVNKKSYEYFLKVFETRHKNENIPLDMIRSKIKKLILQKRKSDILDKFIEELYKEERANDKIKIYN